MSWITVDQGGRRHRLSVARTAQGTWVGWPGGSKLIVPERGASAAAAVAEGDVRAPMTGKVVKVNVAAGDAVEAGDILVILEAMKMEYRLAAPKDGKVKAVACREGDKVELGRTLVTLS